MVRRADSCLSFALALFFPSFQQKRLITGEESQLVKETTPHPGGRNANVSLEEKKLVFRQIYKPVGPVRTQAG